ncbi:MAG: hypothetical protein WAL45_13090 [Terracidiphilus sp.]
MKRCGHFVLMTLTALAFPIAGSALRPPQETAKPLEDVPSPYLLLVTFNDLTGADRLSSLDASPFDGIAVPVVDAYYSGPQLPFEQIQEHFASLQRQTRKQIWPWVFINRMLETGDAAAKTGAPDSDKVNTVDLDDSFGGRTAFLDLWRKALRQAQSTGIPGVVLDMELYSNRKAYSVSVVARQRSLAPNEARKELEEIGNQMAQIASQEFPDVIVWTLLSGLSPARYVLNSSEEDSTCRYILLGMLDGAREHHLKLTLIDGGEDSLGYCHESAAALKESILDRRQRFRSLCQEYGDALKLGGTIALWRDSASRTGWLRYGRCGASDVKQPQDFGPYLALLFQSYRFVWIYAAVAGQWDPLNQAESGPLNRMLGEAKGSVPAAATCK